MANFLETKLVMMDLETRMVAVIIVILPRLDGIARVEILQILQSALLFVETELKKGTRHAMMVQMIVLDAIQLALGQQVDITALSTFFQLTVHFFVEMESFSPLKHVMTETIQTIKGALLLVMMYCLTGNVILLEINQSVIQYAETATE